MSLADPIDLDEAIETLTQTTSDTLATQAGEIKKLTDYVGKLEAKMGRPFPANDNFKAANDNNDLVAEQKALSDYVRHNVEFKTMLAGSDPDGGYGVTPQLSDAIASRLYDQSPLRQICRNQIVGNFDSYEEPRQIGDTGATWVGENSARPATTTPTLGLLNVPVSELYALQPVTQRLLDDSRFDMASFVMERVTDRFARTEGTAFVRGTGVGQPAGFMTVATDTAADFTRDAKKLQHVVSGSGTDVTFDSLKKLLWTMRAPHRSSSSWLMSSATASQLDTLKDGNDRYIWRESIAANLPPTLLGRPVYFSEDMDSVASGNFPIALANWNAAYLIVDKLGVRWLRDPYSSKPSVLFYGYKRVGGGVADTDALKLLKISA